MRWRSAGSASGGSQAGSANGNSQACSSSRKRRRGWVGEKAVVVPMRQQPARRCKRRAEGREDRPQHASTDPDGGDGAAADVWKHAKS